MAMVGQESCVHLQESCHVEAPDLQLCLVMHVNMIQPSTIIAMICTIYSICISDHCIATVHTETNGLYMVPTPQKMVHSVIHSDSAIQALQLRNRVSQLRDMGGASRGCHQPFFLGGRWSEGMGSC